ncbi:unnamed protein product, partial [marine sediment metagenome]
YQKAFELSDQVSDRERYYIEGVYYQQSERTYDKAIEAYNELLKIYPDDFIGNSNLGELYADLEEWDKAIPLLEVNLKNKVESVPSYGKIVNSYAATGYSDFDPPRKEGVCDKCAGKLIKRTDDNVKTVENRLKLYEEQTKLFLQDIEIKATVEILPITVSDEEVIDDKYLKKLKGRVYWVQTDQGGKARMLNLEGMKKRLYNLLAETFIAPAK